MQKKKKKMYITMRHIEIYIYKYIKGGIDGKEKELFGIKIRWKTISIYKYTYTIYIYIYVYIEVLYTVNGNRSRVSLPTKPPTSSLGPPEIQATHAKQWRNIREKRENYIYTYIYTLYTQTNSWYYLDIHRTSVFHIFIISLSKSLLYTKSENMKRKKKCHVCIYKKTMK